MRSTNFCLLVCSCLIAALYHVSNAEEITVRKRSDPAEIIVWDDLLEGEFS